MVLDRLGILEPLRRISATIAMLPPLGVGARADSLETPGPGGTQRGPASLFAGCVNQVLFSPTNDATRRVLRRNGFELSEPAGQACCGALHVHAGDRDSARALARKNIATFAGDAPVVVNAAGCGALLKEYAALLADDPAWAAPAAAFSARVRDVSELLLEKGYDPPRTPVHLRVTYHDACHLAHAQGIRRQPRALLRSIPGLELIELEESDLCCGSAGSYNLTEPKMARRLGDRKAAKIGAAGAAIVAAGNPGCALQIRASLQRSGSAIEVRHPIEILDRAYHAGNQSNSASR